MNVYSLGVLLQTLKDENVPAGTIRPAGRVASIAAVTAIGTPQERIPLALRGAVPGVPELSGDPSPEAEDDTGASAQRSSLLQPGQRPAAAAGAAGRIAGLDASPRIAEALAARLAPDSVAIDISPTATLIGEVLREDPRKSAPTVRPSLPLVERRDIAPQPLAAALQASIEQSGLFYESHLARWALQQYPQSALAQEPQPTAAHDAAVAVTTPGDAPRSEAVVLPQVGHEHTPPLFRQQLEILETRQLAWAGEVWPGQHADIHIREDEARDPAVAQPSWRTSVTLDLPELGHVELSLTLQSNALRVQLQASDNRRAAVLHAGTPHLRQALAGQAFALTGLDITHEADD